MQSYKIAECQGDGKLHAICLGYTSKEGSEEDYNIVSCIVRYKAITSATKIVIKLNRILGYRSL